MQRDYFLDAQQALEMGLVDKVLTSREEQEKAMEGMRRRKGDEGEGKGGNTDEPPPSPAENPTAS